MKEALVGLVRKLFGNVEYRWNYDDFPFTDPSYELEILHNGVLLVLVMLF
jgi:phenylalanyl-tRNA synthetase alpha subunit